MSGKGKLKVEETLQLTLRDGRQDLLQRLMESLLSDENQVQRGNTSTLRFQDPDGPKISTWHSFIRPLSAIKCLKNPLPTRHLAGNENK